MSQQLQRAIASMGKNKPQKAIDLIKENPLLAAIVSKLTSDRTHNSFDERGSKKVEQPDTFAFKNMSIKMVDNIRDSDTVMRLLPDIELCAQILVSSIISPKDMTTTELTYIPPEGLLPLDTAAAVIHVIKSHFEQTYNIKMLLPKILRDILFRCGSYPMAVIPENALDDIINGSVRLSTESLTPFLMKDGSFKPINILGPAKKESVKPAAKSGIAFESFTNIKTPYSIYNEDRVINDLNVANEGFTEEYRGYVTVTDNPDILKVPKINERIREQSVLQSLNIPATESFKGLTDEQLARTLYKSDTHKYQPNIIVKTQEQLTRDSVGGPLVIKLPTESVIPIHIPGVPEHHIGYFVLIDAHGYPINAELQQDYMHQLGSRLTGGTDSFPSAMINKTASMMEGDNVSSRERAQVEYSVKAYADMIEADLLARLKNGVYGNGVAIGRNDEVYRIMMARTLAKQSTQLLFVPIELMTYFAIRYQHNGVGKSLIDDMRISLSLRVMTMFSNVMAGIKNSIGRTDVKLKLDEEDPDPQKTIEESIQELIKSRQQYFPLGINAPTDIVDWLQRAGMEFTFEGHPGLPDVSIDIGEKVTNYTKVDTDLEDGLRKRSIMGFGLSPEMVDNGFQAEFATTVVQNNLLLSKRVQQIQDEFIPHMADFVRKITNATPSVLAKIYGIINDNFDKIDFKDPNFEKLSEEVTKKKLVAKLAYDFIKQLDVRLPAPNSITLETQNTALESFIKILDPILEAHFSSDFFTQDAAGDISNQINAVKANFRAYCIRKWANENGVLPELSALTATDEDGELVNDIYTEQVKFLGNLTKHMVQFFVDLKQHKEAANLVLNKDAGLEGGGTDSTGSGTDNGSSSGGDEFGGDFNMDFGGTEGGEEGTTEETTGEGEGKENNEKEPEEEGENKPTSGF